MAFILYFQINYRNFCKLLIIIYLEFVVDCKTNIMGALDYNLENGVFRAFLSVRAAVSKGTTPNIFDWLSHSFMM